MYFLRYRYRKELLFGYSNWIEKSYTAKDKNDLIDTLNILIRKYYNFYIVAIYDI